MDFTSVFVDLDGHLPQLPSLRLHSRYRHSPDRPITSAAVSTATQSIGTNQTISTAPESTMDYATQMSESKRYLFHLNGFQTCAMFQLPQEIAAAHTAIDTHLDDASPRSDSRNATKAQPVWLGPPRLDFACIFEWPETESPIFKRTLAHPRLIRLMHNFLLNDLECMIMRRRTIRM